MAEEGVWRTVRGRRVYIVDGTIYFGGKAEYDLCKKNNSIPILTKDENGRIIRRTVETSMLTNSEKSAIIEVPVREWR